MSPKDFYQKFNHPGLARETALVKEFLNKNYPSWMFSLKEVKVPGGSVFVTPDYLSIGTDQDFCRTPMTPFAAKFLCDHFGFKVPSKELVELIYEQAEVVTQPITPAWYKEKGDFMRLGSNYLIDNQWIDQKLVKPFGGKLIAGHKKDVIWSEKLKQHPRHVAIFGWMTSKNHPIQPETELHDELYEDYSHGIRLIKDPSGKFSGDASLWLPPPGFAP
jgi:hypothetical protein